MVSTFAFNFRDCHFFNFHFELDIAADNVLPSKANNTISILMLMLWNGMYPCSMFSCHFLISAERGLFGILKLEFIQGVCVSLLAWKNNKRVQILKIPTHQTAALCDLHPTFSIEHLRIPVTSCLF